MTKYFCSSNECLFSYCYDDYKRICKDLTYVRQVSKSDYEEQFRPGPRSFISISEESVELDNPPQKRSMERRSTLLTIGPAFTMALPMAAGCFISALAQKTSAMSSGTYVYTGIITAVASAMVGVFWGIVNVKNREKEYRVEEIKRQAIYREYVHNSEEIIREKYLRQTSDYRMIAPPIEDFFKGGINRYLVWNRRPQDPDFLYVRLGTGSRPFEININIPKDKLSLTNDELRKLPQKLKNRYKTLKDVPIWVDFNKTGMLGVVSEDDDIRKKLISQIVISMCVSVSPDFLSVHFVFGNTCGNCYDEVKNAFRFLPHVMQNETEKSDWMEGLPSFKDKYHLFVTDDYDRARAVCETGTHSDNLKQFYVIAASEFDALNANVDAIVQRDRNFNGLINFCSSGTKRDEIYFDNTELKEIEVYSRMLRGIYKESQKNAVIPEKLSFYELLGLLPDETYISSLWAKNRAYESILAPVGISINEKQETGKLEIDFHELKEGPHGLIAGTTGSGKSEILQTIILSLSINYSPLDVGFFLIDYKGGGMASLFDELPHIMGRVSNLSGKMIQRAMLSIRSENEKRQKIFLEARVNNISEYQKKYHSGEDNSLIPLPHVFIIVDEFAELKKEEPEFMGELISVARVGRSLGVHLILATQKPSGTVDENIWSNSRFKICLRVQDKMDSMEVLHKPDAATLRNPGRGYLQVGNDEVYCQFQGAYTMDKSRGTGENRETIFLERDGTVLNKKEKDRTEYSPQLIECISLIKGVYDSSGYCIENKLWKPPLSDFYGYETNGKLVVGLYDDPKHQKKDYLELDIINRGNHIIQGTFGCGKTTLLMTILRSVIDMETPDTCNIYIVDCTGGIFSPFINSSIVGGIIGTDNEADLEKLILMLIRIIDERKRLLNGQAFRNSVVKDGNVPKLKDDTFMGAIYLAIDGIGVLRERTEGMYDKELTYIFKNGPSVGIFTIVTAYNMSNHELSSRMGEAFSANIPLSLPDKYAYREALKCNTENIVLPDEVCGRGVFKLGEDVVEFQTFFPAEDNIGGNELNEYISLKLKERNKVIEKITKSRAKEIPSIPKRPVLSEFLESLGVVNGRKEKKKCANSLKNGLPVGYIEKTGEVFCLPADLEKTIIVSGKSGSGKSNFVKVVNYVNDICKPECEIKLLIYEESSNIEKLSELRNVAGTNPYVIHFGGQLDRVTFADFSYVPYSQQIKLKNTGMATVRKIDENHFYGDIVIPFFDIKG